MYSVLQKIPFIMELFFNGSFILLYSLKSLDKIPFKLNFRQMDAILTVFLYAAPIVILLVVITNYMNSDGVENFLRRYIFSIIVLIPLVITFGDIEFCFWLSSAHLFSSILSLYDGDAQSVAEDYVDKISFFKKIKFRPAQIVLLSFCAFILGGTFLLMLPFATSSGVSMNFFDALFMATSATCVTGLSTVSLANDFSFFGQLVILLLLQIGGLGIMTLSSSITVLLGKSIGMRDKIIMQDLLDVSNIEELFFLIIDIIKYTFFIELWGGIILTIAFTFEGYDLALSIYYGFFHSISAFCNAGFSVFENSLENYATNPFIHGTIAVLITLGGLGFIVLKELKEVMVKRISFSRISMHSKVVLVLSLGLTVGGALMIFFGEFLNALDSYTLWEKMQLSIFQSVTLRTAGFNTLPLNNLHTFTLYGMTLFMFIGASPGSTGGGVKTTTLAILLQSIKATLKGRKVITLWDRTISNVLVVRAVALTFISITLTSLFIFLLMGFESEEKFLVIFFEVISASGTVGLSLGLTPFLSVTGKVIISILMLAGRIGPLTLVLAIGEKRLATGRLDYPDGRIMVG